VNRHSKFWIGLLVVASLVSFESAAAEAQTARRTTQKRTSASASTTVRKKAPARKTSSRQRSAIARALATAREMADTVTPRYKVDASGDLVPDLRAAAAIIYNPVTNEILWEENSQDQRSIASITKVMTATVFLENNPDLTQPVTIARSDVYQASTTKLRMNDKVTTDDLLHLLLIASDNAAARALARVSPHGSIGFIRRMNEKAAELGLESTHYADPSGLLSDNVSSAYDMARLITLASNDDRIGSIMRTPEYTVHAAKRNIVFRSTNHLLGRQDLEVRAGKTGFISRAGYCLATLLRLPQGGQEVAVVVLGARSNAGRFMETQNLFNWLSSKASTLFATHAPIGITPQQQQQ
jgi:serine-type D-Ala-D-Ala endopeptidase (penicillin-binding protein 7)